MRLKHNQTTWQEINSCHFGLHQSDNTVHQDAIFVAYIGNYCHFLTKIRLWGPFTYTKWIKIRYYRQFFAKFLESVG